jgi:photoactive yellow protein
MHPDFDAGSLLGWLDKSAVTELDSLDFGVIGMTRDGTVTAYNRAEATLSGLTPSRVIGRHFFTAVAPCTNNYLVAHRFEVEETLDDTINYVFTLRMAPQSVHLRLLKSPGASCMFLAVRRRFVHAT